MDPIKPIEPIARVIISQDRRIRMYVVMIVLPILLGVGGIYYGQYLGSRRADIQHQIDTLEITIRSNFGRATDLEQRDFLRKTDAHLEDIQATTWWTTASLFSVGLFSLIFAYLQTGFRTDKMTLRAESEFDTPELASYSNSAEMFRARNKEFDSRFAHLEKQIAEQRQPLTAQGRQQLIEDLKDQFAKDTGSAITKTIIESAREKLELAATGAGLGDWNEKSFVRLSKEVDRLSLRANLNLAIGGLATIASLSVLGYFVLLEGRQPDLKTNPAAAAPAAAAAGTAAPGILLMPTKATQATDLWSTEFVPFLIRFIPRLSLVIFIEIFAFFFLKMYKGNLNEIKYFQNELTNLEAQFSSMKVAVYTGNKAMLTSVIDVIARTERNFILQKGETTVGLEERQRDDRQFEKMVRAVSKGIASASAAPKK
jgi:hypothetical protein